MLLFGKEFLTVRNGSVWARQKMQTPDTTGQTQDRGAGGDAGEIIQISAEGFVLHDRLRGPAQVGAMSALAS